MFRSIVRIAIVMLNSLILAAGLLFLLQAQVATSSSTSAMGQVLYVAPNAQCGEFSGTPPTPVTPCFAHPQLAMDAASSGDVIKIAAGVYQGVSVRNGLTQLLYVDKTVAIRGGYSTSDWTNAQPDTRWVTLDAQKQGRVLYISGEISPTIDGLRLTNGIAAGTWEDASGGGIFIANADPTISHNVIFSNTAAQWGGGIYMKSSDAILQYNNILSNTATGNSWGGGLTAVGGLPTISNNLVRGNSAHVGGGMQVTGGWVISNTITANTARDFGEYGGGGGGVVITLGSDALTLEDNLISGNTSSRDGGGVWSTDRTSNTTIRNNRIMTNTAALWGGGIFMGNAQQLNLENNLIQGNSAGVGGAGMFSQNGTINVRGNTIANNSGGGIYEWYGGDAFYANQITGNVSGNGGGVTLYKSDCAFVNNVIAHNIASQKGSGVFIQGASSRFWNTTFSSNSGGDGIALFVVDYPGPLDPGSTDEVYSHVELTNTIMVNQTTAISISYSVNNTVVSSGALWNGNGANWGGVRPITHTQDVFAPPAFASDGYHLTAGSPAIDRGVSSMITDDIDGQIRPVGAAPDLGADEAMPSALITPKTGGSLVYTGANSLPITILVPPGAIKSAIRLVLEPKLTVTNPPPENFQFAGEAFNLQAFQGEIPLPGLSFLAPVTVTIQVDPAKLPGQLAEKSLQLFWWNGVDWSQQGVTSAANTINHTLTASLSHLSEFAMFAQPKPHLFLPIIVRR